jgi:hypothetical protein
MAKSGKPKNINSILKLMKSYKSLRTSEDIFEAASVIALSKKT